MDTYGNVTSESGVKNEDSTFTPLPFISRCTLVFTSVVIIVSNVVVLAVLGRMRSCLTKMQLFLQSLAVADLLVGLMWLILHFESIVGRDLYVMSNWLCLLIAHLPAIALTVSVLTLSLISIERYIAIVRPFHYHKLLTRRRAKQAVVMVWVLGAALFVPVYLPLLFATGDNPKRNCENGFQDVFYTCMYIMTIVIIPNVFLSFYCYTCIIRRILQRNKILRKHHSSMQRNRRSTDRTLAKISVSVYSGFYITWLPFVVVSCIAYINLTEISPVIYHSTLNFGLWNSLLNCLIYSISHKPFRTELKLLALSTLYFCCCCCIRRATKNTDSKKCCHLTAAHSLRHRKSHVWAISKDLTRDSESHFNVNGYIAKEII